MGFQDFSESPRQLLTAAPAAHDPSPQIRVAHLYCTPAIAALSPALVKKHDLTGMARTIKDRGTMPLENSRACCSDARAMMTYVEIESFFTGLIATAQARGITSGMACVHYGVAATTKDCDVLCACASADQFLDLIDETPVRGLRATYRGHLSPPLDARWLRAGCAAAGPRTSHGRCRRMKSTSKSSASRRARARRGRKCCAASMSIRTSWPR